MWRTFRHPLNILLALGIACAVLSALSAMGSFSLVQYIFGHSALEMSEKAWLLAHIFGAPLFPPYTLESFFLITVSLLIGINSVLTLFYIRLRRSAPSKAGALGSIGGIVASLLGIGCAACGSLVATTILTSVGGLSLLALLPYNGAEIGYLGALLLFISTVMLARHINKPPVCPI